MDRHLKWNIGDSEIENSAELESSTPDIDELRAEAKAAMDKRKTRKANSSSPTCFEGN